MTSEPTALLRGIGNQFNTATAGGLRPLGVKEIRSRLTADLFFADQICIPGTSLLCNPATFKLFNDDMAFLVGLLIGLCQVGVRGGPVRRSHRGAGR